MALQVWGHDACDIWGHQAGWDEISVGWLWAAGSSSRTAQHQGTSGWREEGLWLRAGSSHVARGLGARTAAPGQPVVMVLAAVGPWAGRRDAAAEGRAAMSSLLP